MTSSPAGYVRPTNSAREVRTVLRVRRPPLVGRLLASWSPRWRSGQCGPAQTLGGNLAGELVRRGDGYDETGRRTRLPGLRGIPRGKVVAVGVERATGAGARCFIRQGDGDDRRCWLHVYNPI